MATAGRGRMAAVLFTDMVGSTELLSRVGEAAFDGLRRAHFAALREEIGRSGGVEVKTTGDGLLVTVPSAADAICCAVAMQQAVDLHSRTAGVPLAIRVGVSVGDVSFEDSDVFGVPVVEAARLVAVARAGQILATSIVRVIAGGRCTAHFTDLGSLDLKGLPVPVSTCEVAWEPLPASTIPLPALLTGMGRIFVGREEQLAQLHQLWEEARTGPLRVAFVAGEPGVGKTRLSAELAARAHALGATVLAGRCDEDLGVPYQPFVEALRHFVDHTMPHDLAHCLGRYGGELVRLLPELGERAPDLPLMLRSDPETERYRLFDAVAAWMAATSATSPVLLVLDDLQWAAKPTLLLLRHVLRSTEPMRLLVLVTYRDTEVGRTHPLGELLADLRQLDTVTRVSLSGLDQPAVRAFLEQAAGHDLGDEREAFATAIHQETEGNAFFVREVVRHLTETGVIREEGGRWAPVVPLTKLGIPEGVRDVLGRRLSRLSAEANKALAVAAVAGQEFELAVVERASTLDEERLLIALDEAIAARLMTEVPGTVPQYRFAHALVRATLYDELPGGRRALLHRRVAEAIEEQHAGRLDDYLPALAHHFARAAAPRADTSRAVDYATRAGDRALAQLAHDEAANYYRQALQLLDSAEVPAEDARRAELLLSLGEAERRAGDPGYRATLLAAAGLASRRGDADALARAALANSRGAWWSSSGEIDAERVQVLEEALGAVGDEGDVTRARLLATLGVELVWTAEHERRISLSDEALRLAREHDDPSTLAHVLVMRVPTIWGPRTLHERLDNTAELVRVAERLGDPVTMFRGHYWRFRMAMEAGDVEEADRHLQHARTLSDELGQPTLRWMVGWCRGGRELLAGRISEADELVEQTFDIGERTGQPDAEIYFRYQQFHLRLEQGRLNELASIWSDLHARHALPLFTALLSQLQCEMDREEDARRVFERLAASSFADLPVDPTWLTTVMACAVVAAHLGDAVRAARLRALLAPYAHQRSIAGGICLGPAAHYLGMLDITLGSFDEAEQHFASAAASHERSDAPTLLARTRMEWARMLLDRGGDDSAERARALLGQALTTARELGLGTVERRAVALLCQVS